MYLHTLLKVLDDFKLLNMFKDIKLNYMILYLLCLDNIFKIFTYFLGIRLTSQYTLSVLFLTPFPEFALCCSLCKNKIFVSKSQQKE